nr:cold shock domain-containing protein [Williamsia marianensis]
MTRTGALDDRRRSPPPNRQGASHGPPATGRTLVEGERAEFEVGQGAKGPQAVNVRGL